MPVFNNALAGAAGSGGAAAGFKIERSLRFNDNDSAHLTRTPSSDGDRRTWTWAAWVKRANLGGYQSLFADQVIGGTDGAALFFTLDNSIRFEEYTGGGFQWKLQTTQLFRDSSAWMHIVAVLNTTASTANERVRLYINGSEVTDFATRTNPSQNFQGSLNRARITDIASYGAFDTSYFDGYLADVHFIDGQALAPTDFGEFDATTGVWNPKAYSGTYGTNGFHLDFSDDSSNAALGTDSSGNSNTWTVNNLSVASGAGNDSLLDSPTNYEASSGNNGGNYATLNPLQNGGLTLANGNLDVSKADINWRLTTGTIGISSGKFYWEYIATTASDNHIVGVCDTRPNIQTYIGEFTPGWAYQTNGRKTHNNIFTNTTAANSGGEIIQIAVDMDAGKIWFGINNTYIDSGNPSTGANPAYSNLSGTVLPAISLFGTISGSFNFGQRPFAHTPPTGYKSLCTQNLDDPTIADGSDYFEAKTYTGNGGTLAVTGLEFSPDLVWIKSRSQTSFHVLCDAVRGAGVVLSSNRTTGDTDNSDSQNAFKSFDSNGFTVGQGAAWSVNDSSQTHVAWAWDAGSSNTPISAGSLNSSAYDSSQTWSNGWDSNLNPSFPGTRSFDGDISTGGVVALGSTATWTVPNSGYAISSSLRVYGRLETSSGGFTITFSDSSTSTIPVNATKQWHTISGAAGKTITSIAVTKAANGDEGIFHAVEIDGKILLDNGVTPVDNFPSIASTVRANQTAGCSIVSYTGSGSAASIGHNLNAKPEFIIVKGRTNVDGWGVQHVSIGATNRLRLNTADASQALSGYWNDTDPTSSVFHVGGDAATSGNNVDYIAYCFAPVEGYSAFGSYTGNGSADGPFVYTGFKTRWLMIKSSSNSGEDWLILDTARDTYNDGDSSALYASLSHADNSTLAITTDILSNGFRCIGTNAAINANGYTYIYAAFAEHPFKTARAR